MRIGARDAAAVFCIVGVAAALAGCGGDSHFSPTGDASTATSSRLQTSPPASATSPPSSAASLTDQARSAAIAAYLGMWSDFAIASHTSDWQSRLLSQHATAYALEVLEKSLYTDHRNGVITKGAPVDHPRATSVSPASDPTVVMISDCGDSSHTRKYVVKTGKPTWGSPGGRQAITAEVRKQPDGSWKVDQFAVEGTGTC